MEARRMTRLKKEKIMMEKSSDEFSIKIGDNDNLSLWFITFKCPKDTIYADE